MERSYEIKIDLIDGNTLYKTVENTSGPIGALMTFLNENNLENINMISKIEIVDLINREVTELPTSMYIQ